MQSHEYQDVSLQYLADHLEMVILSVGYRLAPEHPYPAGNEDCFDIGEWLVDNAEKEYGAPLKFVSFPVHSMPTELIESLFHRSAATQQAPISPSAPPSTSLNPNPPSRSKA